MRRYGRTVVSEATSRQASYDARLIGSDHADYAGNCDRPVMIPLTGMRDKRLEAVVTFASSDADYGMIDGKPHWRGSLPASPWVRHIDVAVRCRDCPPCREARRRHWAARARSEIDAAPRTWFGTLTLRPEQQFRLVALANASLLARGTTYAQLSDADQFKERIKPLVREVQLYMKRLRKEGAVFRYLVAIERHKSGAPHVHFLMHEVSAPIRHKALSAQWRLGFSNIKLVAQHEAQGAAYYVAKYLTKESSRLLASKLYGVVLPPSPVSSGTRSF